MFTVESIIDSVHAANQKVINTFVKNEAMRDQLLALVDTQAEYSKDAADRATEMFDTFKASATQAVENAQTYFKKFGK